jgi:hypothetical protein
MEGTGHRVIDTERGRKAVLVIKKKTGVKVREGTQF